MERFMTISTVRQWQMSDGGSLGFVPTMGALHSGHLALIHQSLVDNERTIVSIYVNPLQFSPTEDFTSYPRFLEDDCSILEGLGVDALFLPDDAHIYPPGFSTSVEVTGSLTQRLEAVSRPDHFRGVTTIVTKLMQVIHANRTYFGMKDAQQLLVLGKLVRDLAIPTKVIPVPTVRDSDGLALSSRNRYLSKDERLTALAIPRALTVASRLYEQGEKEAVVLRNAMIEELDRESGVYQDYAACVSIDSLADLETIEGPALLAVAGSVGGVHLIDNHWLGTTRDSMVDFFNDPC